MSYPLYFRENRHPKIWGEESWEISAHQSSPSVVANGPLAGRTLTDVVRECGRGLLGAKAPSADTFPLLFKVIHATRRLSVQVHPNEVTAKPLGGEPKTEMWRILGGHGSIYAGFKPGVSPDEIKTRARDGSIGEIIPEIPTTAGQSFFIPGGLVHCIGDDVTLYEVQQSSDTTYRIHDWGRLDESGHPRPIHIDESLVAIDPSLPAPAPQDAVDCPFFRFRAVTANGTVSIPARADTFTALYIVEAQQSVLVPANCKTEIPATGTVFETILGAAEWN